MIEVIYTRCSRALRSHGVKFHLWKITDLFCSWVHAHVNERFLALTLM